MTKIVAVNEHEDETNFGKCSAGERKDKKTINEHEDEKNFEKGSAAESKDKKTMSEHEDENNSKMYRPRKTI